MDWSGAAAPNASIIEVVGADAFEDSLTGAIDNNLAPIVSSSYAGCENAAQYSQSVVDSFYPLLMMANAQGQTIVAASGDEGGLACTGYVNGVGLAVNFIGSSPFVTAVGGTQFAGADGAIVSGNSNIYFSTTNGPYGGSALSYVPEQVWDAGDGLGSGGGASNYFTKPSWQSGIGVPQDFARDVPDVSLYADAYFVCSASNCANGFQESSGNPTFIGAGTSFSAPIFAGLIALVEQKSGGRLGVVNPTIYALANSSYSSSVFHDVTVGSNAIICVAGTQDCPAGGAIGYPAGVGYDLATGWGSLDFTNLVNSWNLVSSVLSTGGVTLSVVTLAAPTNTVMEGAAINITATVSAWSASTAIPTGKVQFLLDNIAVGTPVPLAAGVAAYSLDTTNVRELHTIEAAYSGDATFRGSRNAYPIEVSPTTPQLASVTALRGTPQTVVTGSTIHFTAMVAAVSGGTTAVPTGSVQFLLDNYTFTVPVLLSGASAAFAYDTSTELLQPGQHTVKATYPGDTNFAASQSSFVFTIAAPSPDFTLTTSATTVTAKSGSSAQLSINAGSLNGFIGNVQLSVSSPNAMFTSNPLILTTSVVNSSTQLTLDAYTLKVEGSQRAIPPSAIPLWYRAGSLIALASVFFWIMPGRRRLIGALTLLISLSVLTVTGCGSGNINMSSMTGSPIPTAPGAYNITITALGTDGTATVTHTAEVTFIIQ